MTTGTRMRTHMSVQKSVQKSVQNHLTTVCLTDQGDARSVARSTEVRRPSAPGLHLHGRQVGPSVTKEMPPHPPAPEHGVSDVSANVPDDPPGGTTRPRGTAQSPEWLYRLLVESVRDYAIFALDRAGNVMTWSAGAARLKGYTAPRSSAGTSPPSTRRKTLPPGSLTGSSRT